MRSHLIIFVAAASLGFVVAVAPDVEAKREERCFGTEIADLEIESVTRDGAPVDSADYVAEGAEYRIEGYGYTESIGVEIRTSTGDFLYSVRAERGPTPEGSR